MCLVVLKYPSADVENTDGETGWHSTEKHNQHKV